MWTKPPVLMHKHPFKNGNVTNFDVINGNAISKYDQAYECHG